MSSIDELLRSTVILPDRREIYDWAAENIDFGSAEAFKGRYDVENVPQTKEFLKACRNPKVREITFIAPPQESGKTKAAETFLIWRACTSPAKMAFNTETNVKAEAWSETRFEQMITSCPKVRERFSTNRHKKKTRRIVFRDGSFLIVQGAEVKANRQSDSIEVQVNDEVFLWQRPWLSEMHTRTRAYRPTRKIVNISIGGKKKSELHERFQSGNQGEWCHRCPACGSIFSYCFNTKDPAYNIRFDLNTAIIHADGRLDLREFAKTVYVFCQTCKFKMGYDADRLATLNRGGTYVDRNPDANPEFVSLHCNSFALGKRPWSEILEPWIKLHVRGGLFDETILEQFITHELAEFWDEKPTVATTELKTADFTRADIVTPKSWKDEIFRVLTADNQRGGRGDIPHRWFVCVAFSATGKMRLVDAGRLNEWESVRKKQVELGVPDATEAVPGPWTVVDRRWDPVEVDEICATYKWYGMVGVPQDEFLHGPGSPFEGHRELFSDPRAIDIGFGTAEMGRRYSMYYLWSSQRVQDLFDAIRKKGMLELPRDVGEFCPELGEQINSHRQIMEPTKTGGEKRVWKRIGATPDHLYDCLCMAAAVGCMAGIYRREELGAPETPKTK